MSDLRQLVRRLHRDNPGAAIVVTGLRREVLAEELAALPGVVRVVPQSRKAELLEQAPSRPGWQPFAVSGYDPGPGRAQGPGRLLPTPQPYPLHLLQAIVPLTAGPSVSRPPAEVLARPGGSWRPDSGRSWSAGSILRQFGRDLPGAPGFLGPSGLLERELAPQWAARARHWHQLAGAGQLGTWPPSRPWPPRALVMPASAPFPCKRGDPGVLKLMGRGHYRPPNRPWSSAGT